MASTVTINPVTRIEGHARITLDLDDGGQVASGHLEVLEIRGFEKLLQGTELFKMPQITARLCGVCPAAHHLASVVAIESGLGVEVPIAARRLRELLYAGHILHSHALSTFVLTGPDLIQGVAAPPSERNIFHLLQLQPEMVKKLLRVRSIGQRVVEIVGGRGVHPVTAIPGGMAAAPKPDQMATMADWGVEALAILDEVMPVLAERLAALDDFRMAAQIPFSSLALSRDGMVDFLTGEWTVLDSDGLVERRFSSADYADHLLERVKSGSYMKGVELRGTQQNKFFVGPLARANVNGGFSTPRANAALAELRSEGVPLTSAVDFIRTRVVEMIHTCELIAELAGNGVEGGPLRIAVRPEEGRFVGAIEAPRGILIHDYTTDKNGRVADINFIVATQNNYDAIDQAITSVARHLQPSGDDNLLMNGVELALRCFDPCLACATHVAGRMPLEITLRSSNGEERRINRGGG